MASTSSLSRFGTELAWALVELIAYGLSHSARERTMGEREASGRERKAERGRLEGGEVERG